MALTSPGADGVAKSLEAAFTADGLESFWGISLCQIGPSTRTCLTEATRSYIVLDSHWLSYSMIATVSVRMMHTLSLRTPSARCYEGNRHDGDRCGSESGLQFYVPHDPGQCY